MQVKIFEVRDRGTFIPVLAIRFTDPTEAERYLLARAGYGRTPEDQEVYIMLVKIDGGETNAHYDPYAWDNRTMLNAHLHLIEMFEDLETGAVIDVQFLLGETAEPKISEAMRSAI